MAVVTVDMTANDAQMFNAWKRSTQSIEAFNNALDKTKGKQAAAKSSGDGMVASSLKGFAAMVGGAMSLQAAVKFCITAQQEYVKETNEAAAKQDGLFRKFTTLSGLSGFKDEASRKMIEQQSSTFGYETGQGAQIAAQLKQEGFSSTEAKGGSLAGIMAGMRVTGTDAGQSQDVVGAVSHYLESSGKEKTTSNTMEAVKEMSALLADTDVTFGQLDAMAAHMATMGKVGKKSKTERKLLAEVGLKPEDIDLQGESMTEAFAKVNAAIEAAPEEKRAAYREKLLGDQFIAGDIMGNIGNVGANRAKFGERLGASTSGRDIALTRLKNRREGDLASKADDTALYEQALQTELESRNLSPAEVSLGMTEFRTQAALPGQTPEGAMKDIIKSKIGGGLTGLFGSRAEGAQAEESVRQRVANSQKSAVDASAFSALTEALNRNTAATEKLTNKPPVAITASPVSRPVPSAALASR